MTRFAALVAFTLLANTSLFPQDIFEAIRSNDPDEVELLIKQTPLLVNSTNERRQTPLHVAAIEGNLNICKLFIDNGALVNATDYEDTTPLHFAASNGHVSVVEYLLEQGAVLDARYIGGASALTMAARSDHMDVGTVLIDSGADIDLFCNVKVTPLWYCIYNQNVSFLNRFLGKGAQVNYRDFIGRTPLQFAVIHGYQQITDLLLENGADLSAIYETTGVSLLHLAAIHGRQKIAESLLQRNFDITTNDRTGKTALDYAVQYGHTSLADYLIKSGAKIANGSTPRGSLYGTQLDNDEAIVVKLQGGSWGVLTKDSLLLLGYSEGDVQPSVPSIKNGYIVPTELEDRNIYHFESWVQADHPLFKYQNQFKNIHFINNPSYRSRYESTPIANSHYPELYQEYDIDGVELVSLPAWANFKGYLIHSDGIDICWIPWSNECYFPETLVTEGIDYVLKQNRNVDIVFLTSPYYERGPEWHTLMELVLNRVVELNPKVVFLMGSGEFTEHFYNLQQHKGKANSLYFGRYPGDYFTFRDGKVMQSVGPR
jgi:ankyrin repeat protein